MLQNTSTHTNITNKNNHYPTEKEVTSRCHGSKISWSQQTVVLQIRWMKTKKLTCMTFLCTLALRNKTVASPYFVLPFIVRLIKWPSLLRRIVEIQKFCYHGNVTSHFSSLLSLFYPKLTTNMKISLLSLNIRAEGQFSFHKQQIENIVLESQV